MKKVTAKFDCVSKKEMIGFKEVEFTPVKGEDFTAFTPSGELKMGLTPESNADEFFTVGEKYLLTFEVAE